MTDQRDFKEDCKLLEELKAGSEEAFKKIYEKHRQYLTVAAYTLLKDMDSAHEVVQLFFIKFWQKEIYLKISPNWEKGLTLKLYLHRCVYNAAMDKVKWNNAYEKRMGSCMAYISNIEDYEELLLKEEIEQKEKESYRSQLELIKKKIMYILGRVVTQPGRSHLAQVFEMRYFEFKSRSEIAEILGVSPNTIRNQLSNACTKLHENGIKFNPEAFRKKVLP